MTKTLYDINDALTALAAEHGATVDDDTLNELTHHVADVLGIEPRSRPTGRHASPQAWRRLRTGITDGEARDIARDIAGVAGCNERAVYEALAYEPWDRRQQA